MQTDGFHYTDHPSNTGYGVSPSTIEVSELAKATAQRDYAWTYDEMIPEPGRRALYFFSTEDLMYLMDKTGDHVTQLSKVLNWRVRRARVAQTRFKEFYLMDLLATQWAYMTDFYGNTIDQELLGEARERQR